MREAPPNIKEQGDLPVPSAEMVGKSPPFFYQPRSYENRTYMRAEQLWEAYLYKNRFDMTTAPSPQEREKERQIVFVLVSSCFYLA